MSDAWEYEATVARSQLDYRVWYPFWEGGAEGDMFPYCGGVLAVKRLVVAVRVETGQRFRWVRINEDIWHLETTDD